MPSTCVGCPSVVLPIRRRVATIVVDVERAFPTKTPCRSRPYSAARPRGRRCGETSDRVGRVALRVARVGDVHVDPLHRVLDEVPVDARRADSAAGDDDSLARGTGVPSSAASVCFSFGDVELLALSKHASKSRRRLLRSAGALDLRCGRESQKSGTITSASEPAVTSRPSSWPGGTTRAIPAPPLARRPARSFFAGCLCMVPGRHVALALPSDDGDGGCSVNDEDPGLPCADVEPVALDDDRVRGVPSRPAARSRTSARGRRSGRRARSRHDDVAAGEEGERALQVGVARRRAACRPRRAGGAPRLACTRRRPPPPRARRRAGSSPARRR